MPRPRCGRTPFRSRGDGNGTVEGCQALFAGIPANGARHHSTRIYVTENSRPARARPVPRANRVGRNRAVGAEQLAARQVLLRALQPSSTDFVPWTLRIEPPLPDL